MNNLSQEIGERLVTTLVIVNSILGIYLVSYTAQQVLALGQWIQSFF